MFRAHDSSRGRGDDFDHVWEVYVPAAKRRWGYYVLPLLWGDRLVGRIEPRLERATATMRIADWWWEAGFEPLADAAFVDALVEAVSAHRAIGNLTRIELPTARRHRELVSAVRSRLPQARRRTATPRARGAVRG